VSTSILDHDVAILPERRRADRITPRTAIWIGRALSAILVLLLLAAEALPDSSIQTLGFPLSLIRPIGALLLACLVLYLIPQTAVLGAILLTGFLGGAVAAQVRVDFPLWTNVLVPVYAAILLWGGLYLREPRLRRLLPFRTATR